MLRRNFSVAGRVEISSKKFGKMRLSISGNRVQVTHFSGLRETFVFPDSQAAIEWAAREVAHYVANRCHVRTSWD